MPSAAVVIGALRVKNKDIVTGLMLDASSMVSIKLSVMRMKSMFNKLS